VLEGEEEEEEEEEEMGEKLGAPPLEGDPDVAPAPLLVWSVGVAAGEDSDPVGCM
jgi:hypothetical protein